jgi:hypothetical protein
MYKRPLSFVFYSVSPTLNFLLSPTIRMATKSAADAKSHAYAKSFVQRTNGIIKKANEVKTRFSDTKVFVIFSSGSETFLYQSDKNWPPPMQSFVDELSAKEALLDRGDQKRLISHPTDFITVSDILRAQTTNIFKGEKLAELKKRNTLIFTAPLNQPMTQNPPETHIFDNGHPLEGNQTWPQSSNLSTEHADYAPEQEEPSPSPSPATRSRNRIALKKKARSRATRTSKPKYNF